MLTRHPWRIMSLGLRDWAHRSDQRVWYNAMLAKLYNNFSNETGLVVGTGLIATGAGTIGLLLVEWIRSDLPPLRRPEWVSLGATLTLLASVTYFLRPTDLSHVDPPSG
jgi:hypothetical protein